MAPTNCDDSIDVEATLDNIFGRDAEAGKDEDGRRESALTELMAVIPVVDEYGYCTGEYIMFSESGSKYTVTLDGTDGREDCECMDMTMHNPSCGCKHIQRIGLTAHNRAHPLPTPDEPADEYVAALDEALSTVADATPDDEEIADYVARAQTAQDKLLDYDGVESDAVPV